MDSISNIIIQIKNAALSGVKGILSFKYSKLALSVLNTLERAGYIEVLPTKGKKIERKIEVKVVYEGEEAKLKGVRRISKSSKRVYQKIKNVFPFKNGYGSLVLSTPKGILTDKEARKEKVGGEMLFEVW